MKAYKLTTTHQRKDNKTTTVLSQEYFTHQLTAERTIEARGYEIVSYSPEREYYVKDNSELSVLSAEIEKIFIDQTNLNK